MFRLPNKYCRHHWHTRLRGARQAPSSFSPLALLSGCSLGGSGCLHQWHLKWRGKKSFSWRRHTLHCDVGARWAGASHVVLWLVFYGRQKFWQERMPGVSCPGSCHNTHVISFFSASRAPIQKVHSQCHQSLSTRNLTALHCSGSLSLTILAGHFEVPPKLIIINDTNICCMLW